VSEANYARGTLSPNEPSTEAQNISRRTVLTALIGISSTLSVIGLAGCGNEPQPPPSSTRLFRSLQEQDRISDCSESGKTGVK